MRIYAKVPAAERMWDRVEICGADECWRWMGHRNEFGYGQIWDDDRLQYVHRVSYEASIGPIAPEMTIDHLCFNPPCVNPSHLEQVTKGENSRRKQRAPSPFCPSGHDLSGNNKGISKRGWRFCRECNRIKARRQKASR